MSRHLEGAPDPVGGGAVLLDLDLAHTIPIENDGVEEFRPLDGKQQEGQNVIGQLGEPIFRKPDRVRQTNDNRRIAVDDWLSGEHRVAQSNRPLLDYINDWCRAVTRAEILHDVGLTRRYYEANLVGAAANHALDEVFADGTGTLNAIFGATADRQQFL